MKGKIDGIISEFQGIKNLNYRKYRKVLSRYPKDDGGIFSKSEILEAYRKRLRSAPSEKDASLLKFLKTKPTRTISGVAPVTVLTKPYKCPGNCIFCPSRTDQPKSYLSSEPGAMRAKMLSFDPYKQVYLRMKALADIGHNVQKVELIILGGTWSAYPRKYQIWFILKCFHAINAFKESDEFKEEKKSTRKYNDIRIQKLEEELNKAKLINEKSLHRCVGLSIETRPDFVKKGDIRWLRMLGVTKIQLGVQTLNDKILNKNRRGHSVEDVKKAFRTLRLAGFKLHIHFMLNLYGSNCKKDLAEFAKLFSNKYFKPDELKLYPCNLLEQTRLYDLYKKGKYSPYKHEELLELVISCKSIVPDYCRITRLFRDIPSFEIVAGVKSTNFRQIVKDEMKKRNLVCRCIRCREIKERELDVKSLILKDFVYETGCSEEHFISACTKSGRIVGFLRLTIPDEKESERHFIEELRSVTIIREVHVYGEAKKISRERKRKMSDKGVQHRGVGTILMEKAEDISKKKNYNKISVIAAVGTVKYYEAKGFSKGELYMNKDL